MSSTKAGFPGKPLRRPPPAPSPGDADLASRILAADRDAESELVHRYQTGLHAIAVIRAGGEESSDLVQETLAAAIANLRRGTWRGEGTLAAYLAAILRNVESRAHARAPAEPATLSLDELPASRGDPMAAAEQHEARIQVREALRRLSPSHREVLVRHYFEDRSAGEIASEMRTPRGTVLSRLHYARLEIYRLIRSMNRKGSWRHEIQGSDRS